MKILIIIPTYNEIDNIEPLLARIFSLLPVPGETSLLSALVTQAEVLVVDDGSPDGTGERVQKLKTAYPGRLHSEHRAQKLGLGTAYVHGFLWGLQRGFDVLIEMDADFSHDPQFLAPMIQKLVDFDVVIGSRYVPGGGTKNWSLARRLLSRGGSFYARRILGVALADFTGGFNGWRREVLEAVELGSLRSDGYSFQIELKYRAAKKQFRIVEFPILFEDRKVGHSKMSKKIIFEALLRVWSFRFGKIFCS